MAANTPNWDSSEAFRYLTEMMAIVQKEEDGPDHLRELRDGVIALRGRIQTRRNAYRHHHITLDSYTSFLVERRAAIQVESNTHPYTKDGKSGSPVAGSMVTGILRQFETKLLDEHIMEVGGALANQVRRQSMTGLTPSGNVVPQALISEDPHWAQTAPDEIIDVDAATFDPHARHKKVVTPLTPVEEVVKGHVKIEAAVNKLNGPELLVYLNSAMRPLLEKTAQELLNNAMVDHPQDDTHLIRFHDFLKGQIEKADAKLKALAPKADKPAVKLTEDQYASLTAAHSGNARAQLSKVANIPLLSRLRSAGEAISRYFKRDSEAVVAYQAPKPEIKTDRDFSPVPGTAPAAPPLADVDALIKTQVTIAHNLRTLQGDELQAFIKEKLVPMRIEVAQKLMENEHSEDPRDDKALRQFETFVAAQIKQHQKMPEGAAVRADLPIEIEVVSEQESARVPLLSLQRLGGAAEAFATRMRGWFGARPQEDRDVFTAPVSRRPVHIVSIGAGVLAATGIAVAALTTTGDNPEQPPVQKAGITALANQVIADKNGRSERSQTGVVYDDRTAVFQQAAEAAPAAAEAAVVKTPAVTAKVKPAVTRVASDYRVAAEPGTSTTPVAPATIKFSDGTTTQSRFGVDVWKGLQQAEGFEISRKLDITG